MCRGCSSCPHPTPCMQWCGWPRTCSSSAGAAWGRGWPQPGTRPGCRQPSHNSSRSSSMRVGNWRGLRGLRHSSIGRAGPPPEAGRQVLALVPPTPAVAPVPPCCCCGGMQQPSSIHRHHPADPVASASPGRPTLACVITAVLLDTRALRVEARDALPATAVPLKADWLADAITLTTARPPVAYRETCSAGNTLHT